MVRPALLVGCRDAAWVYTWVCRRQCRAADAFSTLRCLFELSTGNVKSISQLHKVGIHTLVMILHNSLPTW